MKEETEKLQKKFIRDIHTIATHNPEMLEGILTDEVLVWCLADIDKKVYDTVSTCINLEQEYNTPGVDSRKKNARWILFNYNVARLKEYYDLFLAYNNIRKKRNFSLDFTPTIDKFALYLQQIFEHGIDNESISR